MNRAYDCTVRDAAAEVRTNSNMGFCARYQDTLFEFPILYVLCLSVKLEYASVSLYVAKDNF